MYQVCKIFLYKCTKARACKYIASMRNKDLPHHIWSSLPHGRPPLCPAADSRRPPTLSAYPEGQTFCLRYLSAWYRIFFCILSSSDSFQITPLTFPSADATAPTTAPSFHPLSTIFSCYFILSLSIPADNAVSPPRSVMLLQDSTKYLQYIVIFII